MRILTFTSLFPNSLAPDSAIFLLQRISHLARRQGNQVEVVAPIPYAPKYLRDTSRGYLASLPAMEMIAAYLFIILAMVNSRVSMPVHGLLMYAGCLSLARRFIGSIISIASMPTTFFPTAWLPC